MTVGTDTYVDLAEANDYIANCYFGTERATEWNTKSIKQQEQLLTIACSQLDNLPLIGRKKVIAQQLMFPRWPNSDVPIAVKSAQIEIALLSLNAPDAAKASKRLKLQKQGVKSFSIGDLSESYGNIDKTYQSHPFLSDEKIEALLLRYLQGGCQTC